MSTLPSEKRTVVKNAPTSTSRQATVARGKVLNATAKSANTPPKATTRFATVIRKWVMAPRRSRRAESAERIADATIVRSRNAPPASTITKASTRSFSRRQTEPSSGGGMSQTTSSEWESSAKRPLVETRRVTTPIPAARIEEPGREALSRSITAADSPSGPIAVRASASTCARTAPRPTTAPRTETSSTSVGAVAKAA